MLTSELVKQPLEILMEKVCGKLELSHSQYLSAKEKYQNVSYWLSADESPLNMYVPDIYPQGSLRIRTTVKPLGSEEYDLDLVCLLNNIDPRLTTPKYLYYEVWKRIIANEKYKKMAEPKNRCIRLNYANEFHLDILPACPDQASGGTCILIPDKNGSIDTVGWKASNPIGFGEWFERKSILLTEEIFAKAIEPLPDPYESDDKPVLNCCVQLLKRWRDIVYQDQDDATPRSIVITTLAAMFYNNETTIIDAFSSIVNSLVFAPIRVINPTNPKELLSEKWIENPDMHSLFIKNVYALKKQWEEILSSKQGIPNLSSKLSRLFGESVILYVIEEQAREEIEKNRRANNLYIKKGTGILTTEAIGSISVPRNTFYGK